MGVATVVCTPLGALGQSAPSLGSAASFALLGNGSVTNSGPSRVAGNVGNSTASPVTGFTRATLLLGDVHQNDDLAREAQSDVAGVYQALVGLPCSPLPASPVPAGVYCLSSAVTGILALDGANNPDGFWVFRTMGDLVTAPDSSVVMTNGGLKDHVFWLAAGSATLGTRSVLLGNILALSGITLNPLATLYGRAFARNGPIIIDSDVVSFCCDAINVSPIAIGSPPYSVTITASGGTAPYVFELFAGSLSGLQLGPGGMLSGTPSSPGTFTVIATDAHGCWRLRTYTACPTITLAPLDPSICPAYNQTISASGGTAPYKFGSADMPSSLALSDAGVLTGVPPAGCSTFTITATDASGCIGSRTYTVCVLPPVTLPGGFVGVPYSATIASGASGGFLCGVPPFEPFNPPTISGIPMLSGLSIFSVTSVDYITGAIQIQEYTIVIGICPTVVLSPATLPDAIDGVFYSQQITALPSGTYQFRLTSASPVPFTISPTPGLITGTPPALVSPPSSSPYTFTITATDTTTGCSYFRIYTVISKPVCGPILTIAPSVLPNGSVGLLYSQPLTASGGTPPYTFLSPGGLPPGLALSPAGVLSGLPTAIGSYCFSVLAKDASACFNAAADYTIVIDPIYCPGAPTITMSPPGLPPAILGKPYSQTLTASGGMPPYTFTVTSGALPPGFNPLNPVTGLVSGTPTAVGIYPLMITVTDANGCFATMRCSMFMTVDIPALSGGALLLLSLVLAVAGCVAIRRCL